jgi:hypothetical protein
MFPVGVDLCEACIRWLNSLSCRGAGVHEIPIYEKSQSAFGRDV